MGARGLVLALLGLVTLMAPPFRCVLGARDSLRDASETAIWVFQSLRKASRELGAGRNPGEYPPLRVCIMIDEVYMIEKVVVEVMKRS